ncbi:MAG: hypothetical protein E7545_07090 [Ruminococcaceae bacterium]|nr:hypothetical protein [Oscillospiraceae bacterium]
MAKKVYEESKIQAIADAIREKTGGNTTYTTAEMPEGVGEVYEAGEEAGLDTMWDAIQREGTRTEYGFAFYKWRGEWFYPKYDIVLGDKVVAYEQLGTSTFRNFNDGGDTNFDLTARLEECGVKLDTSKCPNLLYFMLGIRVKRIPTIDLSSATGSYMAFYATSLRIIDKLIFSENTNLDTTTFQYNGSLTTITEVEGVIAKSINFQHSPLDVPSINRIIACLKDYSSIGGTYTLTLKKDRETMLTNAEKAVATNKGWTLVWS